MTDNKIIKALERMSTEDSNGFSSDILNLINCQKTEIENLREENEIYRRANFLIAGQRDERDKDIVRLESELETAKSEAIRKFAKKLKMKSKLLAPSVYAEPYRAVSNDDIDNFVKEMTEEKL